MHRIGLLIMVVVFVGCQEEEQRQRFTGQWDMQIQMFAEGEIIGSMEGVLEFVDSEHAAVRIVGFTEDLYFHLKSLENSVEFTNVSSGIAVEYRVVSSSNQLLVMRSGDDVLMKLFRRG